jgi:2-polyprenyl-6-methoxyphenol hydroxylase-like FAD-dependent oxidoreductase
MAKALVLGGGICGSSMAMMLARDGHDVTVLERDATPPPDSVDEAVASWDRPGVAQFRLAHYTHARFRHALEAELPDVLDALKASGARRYDPVNAFMPPMIEDRSPREDDDKFVTYTGRRPVLERVFEQAVGSERNVDVRRGAKVTELICGPEALPGVPHVVGVRTDGGDEFRADIVIDAMGRASKLPDLLQAQGGRPPKEEAEDCGYTYYGRDFRGELPEQIGPALAAHGTVSILTLPGDNDSWMVVLFMASGDQPLKAMRHEDVWEKVVRAHPFKAHWLDGEPLGGIATMSGIMDRRRYFVVDGKPVVTGLFPVADAWACTNPSLGRGLSLGLWHAQELRAFLRRANGDPAANAIEWDAETARTHAPWYEFQINMDRARVRDMDALRAGQEPPAPDPIQKMFFTATEHDPDIFRGFLEIMACLTPPEELFARPGLFEKAMAAADGKEPTTLPGPTRQELLELVS